MPAFSKSHTHPMWAHLAVGILLAIAAAVWGVQHDVWNSTKLDMFGLTAHGKATLVPNREVAEYDCEFMTMTGQVIQGRLSHSSEPSVFVYLRNNPQVFKVKGSGRGAQVVVGILLILAGWQVRSEERRVGKEGRSRWSPYH